MGCICGKASSAIEDSRESPRERQSNKESSELSVPQVNSSKGEESFRVKEKLDGGDRRVGSIDKKLNDSKHMRDDRVKKKRANSEVVVPDYLPIEIIPKAMKGEQVAAGWPSWLAEVAGEAINGWVPLCANTFEKLDKVCSFSDLKFNFHSFCILVLKLLSIGVMLCTVVIWKVSVSSNLFFYLKIR